MEPQHKGAVLNDAAFSQTKGARLKLINEQAFTKGHRPCLQPQQEFLFFLFI